MMFLLSLGGVSFTSFFDQTDQAASVDCCLQRQGKWIVSSGVRSLARLLHENFAEKEAIDRQYSFRAHSRQWDDNEYGLRCWLQKQLQ